MALEHSFPEVCDAPSSLAVRSGRGSIPGAVITRAALVFPQHGKVVVKCAYGLADFERDVSLSPGSIFDIGSVRKQFVGLVSFEQTRDQSDLVLRDKTL